MVALIVIAVVVVFALIVAARTIRVIPQARAGVVERLGRYSRTLEPGLTIVTPFIDRVKPLVDLREQVVNFSPQSVITEDNVVVGIETVLYFTITDPRSATYEIANPLQAIEQLTVTTLRNVIGGLTLEATLTARENVNTELRVVLTRRRASGASGSTASRSSRSTRRRTSGRRWRSRCARSATGARRSSRPKARSRLRSSPPRAPSSGRADGRRCSTSGVLDAEGERQAAILRAEGEAKAIDTVFKAIHEGKPNRELLSYEYLQMLPQLAEGDSNKVFVIPSSLPRRLAVSARRWRAAARRTSPSSRTARPMFDSLAEKLQGTLADVRNHGTLTEGDIDGAMREIRLALLEADVNFKVVRQFTAQRQGALLGRGGHRQAERGPAGGEDRRARS